MGAVKKKRSTNPYKWWIDDEEFGFLEARGALMGRISSLGKLEFRLVDWLTKRLLMGQKQYGLLEDNLKNKDLNKEAVEEGIDKIVYLVCMLMKDK